MNKKSLIVIAIMMLTCIGGVFAFGIGVQGGYNLGVPGNVAITFKLDSVPIIFAGNFYIADDLFAVGLTGDYWMLNENISGPFNWFTGAGVGTTISIPNEGKMGFLLAARVPVGINAYFADNFVEPYIQLVPMLDLSFLPSIALRFDLDLNLGVRFWFD